MLNSNLLKILLTVVFEGKVLGFGQNQHAGLKALIGQTKSRPLIGKLRIFQIFRDIRRPEDTNSEYLTAMLCGYRAGLHGYAV